MIEVMYMTIGQRIRTARKAAGLTQADLAKILDIPYQGVSQWERDLRNPKMETLEKIATALNISVFDLMGVQEDNGLVTVPISGELASLLGLDDNDTGIVIGNIHPKSEAATALTDLYGDDLVEAQQEALRTISRIKEKLDGASFRKLSNADAYKAGFLQFKSDEDRLAFFYGKLNDDGKRVAADRIQELSEIPKYQKNTEEKE
jgi:transcriptional regulator with XRE-family HTH domain